MALTLDDLIQAKMQKYKVRASEKGRGFKLTYEHFKQLVLGDCHYCALPASEGHPLCPKTKGQPEIRSNGVDRKNNDMGYVAENCVSCCYFCNQKKGTIPWDVWAAWVKRAAQRASDIGSNPVPVETLGREFRRVTQQTQFFMHRRKVEDYARRRRSGS